MKKLKLLTLGVFLCLPACTAGTLTLTNASGVAKSYRVLNCTMTDIGEVTYKDMLGQTIVVSEPFKWAHYENSFNAKRYENCTTCN